MVSFPVRCQVAVIRFIDPTPGVKGGQTMIPKAHTRSTTSCYCNIHNIFLGFPWCAWTMVMNGRWYEDQPNRPTKLTHALAFQNVWWLPNCAVSWKWCKQNKSSYWSNGYWHHNQCCQVLDQSPYDRLEVLLGNAAQGNKKHLKGRSWVTPVAYMLGL